MTGRTDDGASVHERHAAPQRVRAGGERAGAAPQPAVVDEMEIMTRRWLTRQREAMEEVARLTTRRRRRSGPLAPLEAWSDVCDAALRRLSQDIDDELRMARSASATGAWTKRTKP